MSDRTLPGIPRPSAGGIPTWLWVVAGILVVVVISVIVAAATSSKRDYNANTSFEAIAQCETAIKEKLKAPTTADFSSTATGSGTWTVVGAVDAENSFGAKVRSHYQCSVIIDDVKDTARVRIDRFE